MAAIDSFIMQLREDARMFGLTRPRVPGEDSPSLLEQHRRSLWVFIVHATRSFHPQRLR